MMLTDNEKEVFDEYKRFLNELGSERTAAILTVAAQLALLAKIEAVSAGLLEQIKNRVPYRD